MRALSGAIRCYSSQRGNRDVAPSRPVARKRTPNQILKFRREFDTIGAELGVRSDDDWYQLADKAKSTPLGDVLTKYYGGSLKAALVELYPAHRWKVWLLGREYTPRGFWKDKENRRAYFDWLLATKFNKTGPEGWYDVNAKDFHDADSLFVLKLHGKSFYKSLVELYPEFQFDVMRFKHLPPGFWDQEDNHRLFLENLMKILKFKDLDDFYALPHNEFIQYGGISLLQRHGSLWNVLKSVYPDHNWLPWRFHSAPQGFWLVEKNRRDYLKWLEQKLELRSAEDWAKVTDKALLDNFGSSLLQYFNGSVPRVIESLYPGNLVSERRSRRFWTSGENVVRVVREIAHRLKIERPEEWYRVPKKVFADNGASRLIRSPNVLLEALRNVYPRFEWDESSLPAISEIKRESNND